jgi:hypothetical protein
MLPIIIHLLNRRRYRTVEWGAMMFLLQAAKKSRKQSRIRHFLILAARMCAIAALIFLIARPLASGWLSLFGGAPDTVIVILDRSASMEQQDLQTGATKRSTALTQVVDTLQKTGAPRHLVLIDSGAGIVHPLDSVDELLALPDTLGTDAAADIPDLLQTALEYVTANEAGRTDVWICSDLQSSDWNPDAGQWAAIRDGFGDQARNVRFQLLAYRQFDPSNLSVRVDQIERIKGDDTDILALDIMVQGEPNLPKRTVPLAVVLDGARTVVEVTLEGGRASLKGYEIALESKRESGWGKLELPNDANQRDNSFYFSYGPQVTWKTVIVSNHPETVRPFALAAAPRINTQPLDASTITPDTFTSIDLANVAMVVWHAALPQGSIAAQLQSFVDTGGVCFFLPTHDNEDSRTIWGSQFGPWQEAPADASLRIEQWRNDSGLLSNVNNGRALPIGELEVNAYCRVQGEGQPLARLANGDPLLVRVPTDRGGVYFLGTLPTMPDSNLAQQGITLFAMTQRALASGADRLATSRQAIVGKQSGVGSGAKWRRLSESDADDSNQLATVNELSSGVYQSEARLIAANRPTTEDRSRPLEDSHLEEMLSGLDYRVVNDSVRGSAPLIREIWKLFAAMVLVALLGEAILCLPDLPTGTRTAAPPVNAS